MGEVRIAVTLTNQDDARRARQGALPAGQVRTYTADALVDTGAVRCYLPPFVADHLGLERIGHQVAQYADGSLAEVPLTEGFRVTILQRTCTEDALILGDEVLLGQTVLEKLDLLVDCRARTLRPNPAHPDQPINKVK